MHCLSASFCKAGGNLGEILSWDGSSWGTESSGITTTLKGVSCTSDNICRAVGDSGALLSGDGSSRTVVTPITSTGHSDVDCTSDDFCKAVGFSGSRLSFMQQSISSSVSAGFEIDFLYNRDGCTGVTVNQNSGNAFNATDSLKTGRYWSITTLGCTGNCVASLTLPVTFTPDANDKACRYVGGVNKEWACYASDFDNVNDTITHTNVKRFSTRTAGNDSGPAAVTLQGGEATSGSTAVWLVLVAMFFGGLGTAVLVLRTRVDKSH